MASTSATTQGADHHYVPKFYLKGFTDDKGCLWVHEKGKSPRSSTPKAEANREDYYVFHDRGYADDTVEKKLSQMESLIAPVFKKIGNPQFEMDEQQCQELYTFAAMTFVRVPAYRDFVDVQLGKLMKKETQDRARNAQAFYASLKAMEEKTGHKVGDYEKIREFALSENYTVSQGSRGYNLRISFQTAMHITEMLEQEYKHDLWFAPAGHFFMTCDNPIATIRPDRDGSAWVGGGFGWRDTEVIFPLNKRVCLLLRRRGRKAKVRIDEKRLEYVNRLMMGVAQKYLYASLGYRRISRLFEERGCKIKYGDNALMPHPPGDAKFF